MSKLLIIDSHAVVHRAYHSIPPLSHNGQMVNAIYGFYSMLLSAISQLKPKYVIICSDAPGPNFRNAEFIGYRAKRVKPDRDLVSQFPILDQSLIKAKLPVFSVGGYEADDLIATVTKSALLRHEKKTKKPLIKDIYIVTGDKDIMQLVSPKVKLYMPIRGLSEIKIVGPAEVKDRLGVNPDQVVDLKALIGDSSDNYPGIPGVGPVAAEKLLTQYGTLNNIYQHLDDINGSIKEKLVNNKSDAYLSQRLAQLVDDVQFVKFKLKDARWSKNREADLVAVFSEFGFKSLISRLSPTPKTLKKEADKNQPSLF